MRPLLLVLTLALSAGCGMTPLAAHRARVARSAPRRVTVALQRMGDDVRVVVRGRLDGNEATWMLDTGANGDGLSASDAERRGLLDPHAAQSFTVRADGVVASQAMTRPASLSLFGHAETAQPFAVLDVSEGTTGLLSPQRRAPPDGAVELDLVRGVMFELHGADATRALDEVARAGAWLSPWRDVSSFIPTVSATVDGHAVTLVVDTGAPVTTLYADTDAGVRETMRVTRHAIAWAGADAFGDTDAAIVPRAAIGAAGVTLDGPIAIFGRRGSSISNDIHGLLGLDVLRACTIVLAPSRGAIACEPPRSRLAPTFVLPARAVLAPSAPLAARPFSPPPGAIARVGCEALTPAAVAAWAQARGYASSDARATRSAAERARVFSRAAASLRVEIPKETVDHAVDAKRVELGADGFDAALAQRHLTLAALRLRLEDQLLEARVTQLADPDSFRGGDASAMTRAIDVVAARLRDRLARVPLRRTEGRCDEAWPDFHLERVALEGLHGSDADAVRLALARVLEGATVTLGVTGTLPSEIGAAVGGVFRARGLDARVAAREDGDTLRLTVTLVPRGS
jgi:predicted aspartyl protease